MNLQIVLLILALICFLLDAFGVVVARVRWLPLGLALWVLSIVVVGTLRSP